VDARTVLRLRGYLSPAGAVAITVSHLEDCTDCGWPPNPRGEPSLILRDAGRTALTERPFSVARSSGEGPVLKPRFRRGVPFSDEATSAEIRKGGEILWEKRVSRWSGNPRG
jgi:hypothetical protein